MFIAAPAKEICGEVKKATPLADCSLTYPPVCIAAPAKKRGGELKTPAGRKWPRVFIAAPPAKEICGEVKKATPLSDCSLTYPPVCIAAPAKKRSGELKTPLAIPAACNGR